MSCSCLFEDYKIFCQEKIQFHYSSRVKKFTKVEPHHFYIFENVW